MDCLPEASLSARILRARKLEVRYPFPPQGDLPNPGPSLSLLHLRGDSLQTMTTPGRSTIHYFRGSTKNNTALHFFSLVLVTVLTPTIMGSNKNNNLKNKI